MMTFQSSWMNDDLRMFRKTVRQFIEEKCAPHHARWCREHRPDPEAWTAAVETGILLTDMPEEYAGAGTSSEQRVAGKESASAGIPFRSNSHSLVSPLFLTYA